ncbi:magnesium and cobalt transporter [Shimia gijangensis]|uniref:Magnesium and cobalt transporter n=1 Tax=Shimia gijangensis TaxID=1470563 RepID=A0A1M6IK58_9RHOB|nr:hemolysin family protein [Shimia gijangensis]SHJ34799.1 magnesium and cobalt transporter [Shimia gijangensis]
MGDSSDGSSNAAPSAQPKATAKSSNGFFGRIVKAISTSEEEVNEQAQTSHNPRPQTHGMINLRRMRVEDVAIPKADIIAVPSSITKSELVDVFRETGLTRLPVFEGTLDTPLGFAHLKDIALKYGFNGSGGEFSLSEMLRPLVFVPPSMTIGVLLTKMQTERRHMALVIDEYGGVDGLVTIEDLIEQVIGEIEDEHDAEEDQLWVMEAPGCYLAQAKMPLDEFEAEAGRKLTAHNDVDAEDVETLGGLVFTISGHVPARGEVVAHPDGTEFEIVDADPRRIKRLRVRFAEAQDG